MRAARAALEQARRPRSATPPAQLKRNEDLVAKGFVSQASLDAAKMRADRAVAGVANAQAAIAVAQAERAQRAGGRRLHADPRAVRRRDRVEERRTSATW